MKAKRKPRGRGQLVEYGHNWQTPPPVLPGKLLREVVIGLQPGKPKKQGGKK